MLLENLQISQGISVNVKRVPNVVQNVNQIFANQIKRKTENEYIERGQLVLCLVLDMILNIIIKLWTFYLKFLVENE